MGVARAMLNAVFQQFVEIPRDGEWRSVRMVCACVCVYRGERARERDL